MADELLTRDLHHLSAEEQRLRRPESGARARHRPQQGRNKAHWAAQPCRANCKATATAPGAAVGSGPADHYSL